MSGYDPFADFIRSVLSDVGVSMEKVHDRVDETILKNETAPVPKTDAVDMAQCRVCSTYFEPHPLMIRWNTSNHRRNKYLCLEHWK